MREDLLHISIPDFQDINHCIAIMNQIIATKELTREDYIRMRYVNKLFKEAHDNIIKSIADQ